MRRWLLPVEPADLVQILRNHSLEKQGPFAWRARAEDSRPALFLDVMRRSGRGGFRCTVRAVRFLTSVGGLAKGSVHIITLRISKARGNYASVIMTCRKIEQYAEACQYFASEMDKLLAELSASMLRLEQGPPALMVTGMPAREPRPVFPVDDVGGQPKIAESSNDWEAPHVGHPGLDHDELIYRLAKAQEAEEIRQSDKRMTWKWIAREIKWNKGTDKAGIALLADARQRLHRLPPDDPLLAEIAAWRRAKETKKT